MKNNLLFFILIYCCFSITQLTASSTDKKIATSKTTLTKTQAEEQRMNRQLSKIAKDIKKAQIDNLSLNKKLTSLSKEYHSNEASYKKSKNTLANYDENLENISKDIKEKKETYINLLAQQFSIIHAMRQSHEASRESIIKSEMYSLYKIHNDEELKQLRVEIDRWKIQKKKIINKRWVLKKKINSLTKQRRVYENNRKSKQNVLKKLSSDEDDYRKKLQYTLDKQNALRSTLADLNIIHKQEVKEEKKRIAKQKAAMLAEAKRKKAQRKARKLAREKARATGKKVVYDTSPPAKSVASVRKIGSSYKRDKVYSYRGGKTISPLPGSRLVKGFGTYIDPIYKIKIFNESITLRAPRNNAKVYNVLNGKVVFAGVSSMLGKVVVVAHGGRMHTVYAGLSKIAPNLRKGSRIQKGYVIGKVSKKLIFEATKNSKHINPTKLIRI